MPRPIIGIIANFYDGVAGKAHPHARMNAEYIDAIDLAGGLPIIMPPLTDPAAMDQFLDGVGGVLFGGGYDIDPARFGQPRHAKTELLAARLEPFIFAMFARVDARANLPALGICLGHQVFNVARGGTLHQHLPDVPRPNAIDHFARQSQYTGGRETHFVRVEPGTLLAGIVSGRSELAVNSGHHQGIDRVGTGLCVSATAPDGVIEALEDPAHRFLLSIQWHPEDLAPTSPEHLALFQSLVNAARQR
ncbi:MAG: gamma-glutamyl-gamma-aminobutyrate hydrolase family protein, partial [Phycisphaerae bacterium]|nr:gamma-glutamyl-gamma-aminobutyrate hydrolase family protein [Phycisphaerae bacterium]